MSRVSDIYAYWRAALAGQGEDELRELRLPTVDGVANGEAPQCGLWKVSHKKGAPKVLMQVWLAHADGTVADKWTTNLLLTGQIDRLRASPEVICDRWLFAEPCSKEEAAFWRQHGRWPADPEPLPTRTHNLPSDPFEALSIEVTDRLEQASQWLTVHAPIGSQVDCDKARNYQAELLGLLKRADAMHEAEKRPIIEAGRAVDRKFDFRASVRKLADALRDAFEAFMRAEERRLQEERDRQWREDQARVEAERQRIEAERAQKLADDPAAALTDPEPEMPAMPPPPAPVKVQSGGGVGRKAGLRDDWEIEITDYKLAALHVIEQPDVSIVVGKAIQRLVRAAKGKIDIPGVTIRKIRRAA
jgi:hypothetical protein